MFLLYLALEVQHEEIPMLLLVPIFSCFPPSSVPLSCQSMGKARALNAYKFDLKKIPGRKSSDLQRLKSAAAPWARLQLLPRGEGLLLELEISLALRLLGSCRVCLAKPTAPASAEAQHMEAFCAEPISRSVAVPGQ